MEQPIYKFNTILDIISKEIDNISYPYDPQSLFEPVSYILSLGGKRVRPALALMSYNLYHNDIQRAMPVALAVEIFHNFSLLHDDLMDRAEVRRGKPTVHVKWSENSAILSGDAMLIEAYRELTNVSPEYLKQCLAVFTRTSSEVCCGQQLDMEFEKRLDVTIDEYLEMIRLKTAVLLAGSLQMGAIIANAPLKDKDNLYQFGINIGLAFQLMDDLLDVYGDSKSFGKRIGGDILSNKKTFLLISALDSADKQEELHLWLNKEDYNPEEKIRAVTEIYNHLGIKGKTEVVVNQFYEKAISYLDRIDVTPERKMELLNLAKLLKERNV